MMKDFYVRVDSSTKFKEVSDLLVSLGFYWPVAWTDPTRNEPIILADTKQRLRAVSEYKELLSFNIPEFTVEEVMQLFVSTANDSKVKPKRLAIFVYTGNRFYEAEKHLLSLGYQYGFPSQTVKDLAAAYLHTDTEGYMTWTSSSKSPVTHSLAGVLALTEKDTYLKKEETKEIPHQYQPYERVLVCDHFTGEWTADFFSHYRRDSSITLISGRTVINGQILPYNGNEKLLGTKF